MATRAELAAAAPKLAEWFFTVDESYMLFELDVAHALLVVRQAADEWPPRYKSWSAPG
jgi:hypothetical protein